MLDPDLFGEEIRLEQPGAETNLIDEHDPPSCVGYSMQMNAHNHPMAGRAAYEERLGKQSAHEFRIRESTHPE